MRNNKIVLTRRYNQFHKVSNLAFVRNRVSYDIAQTKYVTFKIGNFLHIPVSLAHLYSLGENKVSEAKKKVKGRSRIFYVDVPFDTIFALMFRPLSEYCETFSRLAHQTFAK